MELALTVVAAGLPPAALLVQAEQETTVAELGRALSARLGRPDAGPLYRGALELPGDDTLGGSGVVHGSVIGLGRPVDGPTLPASHLELAVIGGPAAGPAVAIHPQMVVTVGRDEAGTLVVDDPNVSRRHALVTGTQDGAVVEDASSRNGVGFGDFRITGPQPVTPGDVFQVGESIVALRPSAPAATVLDPAGDTWTRRFNRPPRLPTPPPDHRLDVPSEPQKPTGRRFPLASLLVPVAIGIVLVFLTKSWLYAGFILLSPVMLVANHFTDRRSGRKDYRAQLAAYRAATANLDATVAALAAADERARREAQPDPAALVRIAAAPTARLWERRSDDADFLTLRVGLADQPAEIRFSGAPGGRSAAGDHQVGVPLARRVPVGFGLAEAGVVGLAGPRAAALGWGRAMLAQLAVLHSPQDLQLVVLTGQDDAADWSWTLWLPHTVPPDPGWGCRRLVGAGRQQVEERLTALRRLIDDRLESSRHQLLGRPPAGRRVVVVIDGARRLRALPGLAEVLRNGPEAGVFAICLDDQEHSLPEECRVTVAPMADTATRVVVRSKGREPIGGVFPDGMGDTVALRIARALAPIRDAAGSGGGPGEVPRQVRLLDLLGFDPPTAEDVCRSWDATPGGHPTEVVIGVSASGPFAVDLRRDGPHGLVAGTTGAGKSELLQSLVASLAVANPPEALAFVLVDYKGGSAFKECQLLPHCVGLVTDLDGHLAARALASLTAELKRREALLAAVGAKDLDEYWVRTEGAGAEPLPRLAIVVDEFATLADEVPEFVGGVVGIGMRGRSLGVHVVLATQRPAGVVSAEMRANVNLRICLRVANAGESNDVIEVPDASRISRDTPGRAFARTGYQDLTVFQAARVGVARPVARSGSGSAPITIEPLTLVGMGGRPPEADTQGAESSGPTDLTLLVSAIEAAARQRHARPGRSPWLPPLPDLVPAAALPAPARPLQAVVGLVDMPAAQIQEPFVVDLEAVGSVLLVGAVRSGRSTALRTIAAGVCTGTGPEDLHLYGIDAGNRALEPLAELPHTGAVVSADDPDRLTRLFDLLAAVVATRSRTGGAGPAVLVLVDRLEAFVARYAERDGGRLVDALERLLRDGPAVGMHFVISGDRTGLSSRLASAVEARLVLRQADRSDYGMLGLDPRHTPTRMPNGRALWVHSGHEVQIAALGPDGTEAGQVAALAELARALRAQWPASRPGRRPRRVDPLPDRISLTQLVEMAQLAEMAQLTEIAGAAQAGEGPGEQQPVRPHRDAVVTVGAGGDEVTAIEVDLAEVGPGFVIAGPPRSGRSTALATVVRTLSGRERKERAVVLVTPRVSPLRDLAGLPGVVAAVGGGSDFADALQHALGAVVGPGAVIIDDAELIGDGPAARVLELAVKSARDSDLVIVAAATTDDLLLSRYRGWLADARRSRAGLLLTPASPTDGEVFDLRLPRSGAGGWPPGRGILTIRGSAQVIQVAQPE